MKNVIFIQKNNFKNFLNKFCFFGETVLEIIFWIEVILLNSEKNTKITNQVNSANTNNFTNEVNEKLGNKSKQKKDKRNDNNRDPYYGADSDNDF